MVSHDDVVMIQYTPHVRESYFVGSVPSNMKPSHNRSPTSRTILRAGGMCRLDNCLRISDTCERERLGEDLTPWPSPRYKTLLPYFGAENGKIAYLYA